MGKLHEPFIEKEILLKLNTFCSSEPLFVNIHYTESDDENVYLFLEYCSGGTLETIIFSKSLPMQMKILTLRLLGIWQLKFWLFWRGCMSMALYIGTWKYRSSKTAFKFLADQRRFHQIVWFRNCLCAWFIFCSWSSSQNQRYQGDDGSAKIRKGEEGFLEFIWKNWAASLDFCRHSLV